MGLAADSLEWMEICGRADEAKDSSQVARGGPEKSRNWLTFLRNHVQVSWAMDFFTVVTLRFQILYVFVVLNHARRGALGKIRSSNAVLEP